MEIITGRITADAQVKTLKDKRQLVSFCVAKNRAYISHGEKREETSFYNCAYWVSTKVAGILTKGSIVSVTGHTGINAYKGMDGEYHASLTFHVNHIDVLHHRNKKTPLEQTAPFTEDSGTTKDDLPF